VDLLNCLVKYDQSELTVSGREEFEVVEEVGEGEQSVVAGEADGLLAVAESNHFGKRILFLLVAALLNWNR
jgi:hypothetical protein